MSWDLKMRGGAFDEWTGVTDVEPQPLVVVWKCVGVYCEGHATFDAHDPEIVLKTAEVYRRVEVDLDERLAIYEVGEYDPSIEVEERELAGVGVEDGIAYGLADIVDLLAPWRDRLLIVSGYRRP